MESLREFIAAELANINSTLRQKAVVLDAFSGIGSAILCLKRLGIAMKTVITVEYDPIARFVSSIIITNKRMPSNTTHSTASKS